MPVPHFCVSVISRGGGRSAVATAAYDSGQKLSSTVASASYISGEKLHDAVADKTFDYTRKENIVHTEILTPTHAPDWTKDRESLWNAVEKSEKRKDSQLARSIIAALPRELPNDQNIALVRDFAQKNFVDKGMVVDFAVHDKDASDGERNPHVHMLLTMRDLSPDGFGKKNREWNSSALLETWRDNWEQTTNEYLEAAGRTERVSLKSYEEQGIDKIPTQHLGYETAALEKKGEITKAGTKNREIKNTNYVRDVAKGAQSERYGQKEIDDYYQKAWQERGYEPDRPALDRHWRDEQIQRRIDQWQKYEESREKQRKRPVAITRSETTWYGATTTHTKIKRRAIAQPPTEGDHKARIARMMKEATSDTGSNKWRDAAERVARMARVARDKATEIGQSLFDTYTDWRMRQQLERNTQNNRGMER